MRKRSVLSVIKGLRRQIFTTREISSISGKSSSCVTQALNNLVGEKAVTKIYRGVWAEEGLTAVSPYAAMPYLFPKECVYISFISALHIHGMVEQIPQVTTIASTAHGRVLRTKIGVFYVHHITSSFFSGFGWYKGNGSFLIADPEKALIDSLYLSAYKKKRFGHFPELHFPASFSFEKAKRWANKIPSRRARAHVKKRIEEIIKGTAI